LANWVVISAVPDGTDLDGQVYPALPTGLFSFAHNGVWLSAALGISPVGSDARNAAQLPLALTLKSFGLGQNDRVLGYGANDIVRWQG
jgi:hypothetical protein